MPKAFKSKLKARKGPVTLNQLLAAFRKWGKKRGDEFCYFRMFDDGSGRFYDVDDVEIVGSCFGSEADSIMAVLKEVK